MLLTRFNLFFLLSVLFVWLLVSTDSGFLLFVYSILIFVYTVFNTRLGLAAWCMVIPLSSIIGEFSSIFFTTAFLFPYFLKFLRGKEPFLNSVIFKYTFILLILAFLSSIITGYTEYIHVLLLFLIVFLMSDVIYQQLKKESEYFFVIGNSFIVSAFIALLFSLLQSEEIRRLALEESVRQLSNVIGFGIIIIVTLYFFIPKPKKSIIAISQYKLLRYPIYFLLPVLVFGLISTMSRGTIFSIIVPVLALIIFTNIKIIKKFNLITYFKLLVGLFLIAILIYNFNSFLIRLFEINMEDLVFRLDSMEIEGGVGIRQKIWEAGISGLEGWKMFYGHGVSSFRMLAFKSGYNYYSHSVFIDIFVTTGLIGVTVLFFLFKNLTLKILKHKSVISATFLFFLVLNFATHGSMGADIFWFSLAFSFGLVESNVNHNK